MGTRVVSWTKDTTGLSNALWTGVDHAQTNYPYDSVYLGFDEEVPFSSLGVEDFTLTRDGQEVALDSRLVCGILPKALLSTSATQEWKLVGLKNFASQDGEYVLTVDLSCVSDLSGNVGAGKFSVSWIVDASLPSVVVDENAAQDLEQNYVVTLSIVELDGYGAKAVLHTRTIATS